MRWLKADLVYDYEKPFNGSKRKGRIFPDFSFTDASGDLIIWEHFGRMDDPQYVKGHDWKIKWYADNDFIEGRNLFVTTETLTSGVDSSKLDDPLSKIKDLI